MNTNSEINEDKKTIQELSKAYKNRMIYISSSTVYGNNSLNKINELSKTNPLTNYAKNKLICEEEVIRNRGIVLRISNVFGARMSNKSVFHDILNQLHKNTICLNNFYAERDFIFIDDVCSAIECAIYNPSEGIYNVSTGDGITVKKICDAILESKGLDKQKFKYVSKNKMKSSLVLDPILFKKTFNWNTKISLHQGINKLLNKEI